MTAAATLDARARRAPLTYDPAAWCARSTCAAPNAGAGWCMADTLEGLAAMIGWRRGMTSLTRAEPATIADYAFAVEVAAGQAVGRLFA